jgi:hypothetical protein
LISFNRKNKNGKDLKITTMKLIITQTQKNNNTLFMNLSKKIAATAFMFIAFVTVASAQIQAQVTSNASATIIKPITLGSTAELAFGNIIPTATGTVKITTAGVVTATGAQIATDQKGAPAAAAFDVTGEQGFTYVVTLPGDTDVILTLEGTSGTGAKTMPVKSFNHDITGTPKLSETGTGSFKVGATLHVTAGQDAGVYKGDYIVKVNYN